MSVRLKIHDGSPHEEGTIYLGLFESDPGHIVLSAVDQNGECLLDDAAWEYGGALLTVTADGFVSLSPAVLPDLGFERDQIGRIRLDPYSEKMTATHCKVGGQRRFRLVGSP